MVLLRFPPVSRLILSVFAVSIPVNLQEFLGLKIKMVEIPRALYSLALFLGRFDALYSFNASFGVIQGSGFYYTFRMHPVGRSLFTFN